MEIDVTVDDEFDGLVNTRHIVRAARQVAETEYPDRDLKIGILVTGHDEMKRLNKKYRGHDQTTDILSFSLSPLEAPDFVAAPGEIETLGELAISYPQAVSQALEYGHSLDTELAILVVHGILHLLGYDHSEKEQADEMEKKEAAILEMIGEKGD